MKRKKMAKSLIFVEAFTHSNSANGLIHFEENDFKITSIGVRERLSKNDFNLLWEAINDVETKDLKTDKWYLFAFTRHRDDDGSCWFELEAANIIEA